MRLVAHRHLRFSVFADPFAIGRSIEPRMLGRIEIFGPYTMKMHRRARRRRPGGKDIAVAAGFRSRQIGIDGTDLLRLPLSQHCKTGRKPMQRGPLKALLAVLAVAGYQNRDKIAEILKGVTGNARTSPQPGQASQPGATSSPSGVGLDDILGKLRSGGLGSILGGGSIGSILNGGLNDLLDQFRQSGQQTKAESWVKTGSNEPINDTELAEALGPDVIKDLVERTGLSEAEILQRLSKNLPGAVDDLTPDGKVPPGSVGV
jgi:uncharacterized protein YidB (DUF937 family)